MKRSQWIQLAIVAIISAASMGAQAAGLDLHSFAIQHGDALAGIGMMAFGSMDLVMKGLDKIEGRIQAGDRNLAEVNDRLLLLEQKGGADSGGMRSSNGETFGDQLVRKFAENRELFDKTRSVRIGLKAAGDPVTTSSGRKILSGGVVGAPGVSKLGLQFALPTRTVAGISSMEYSRYTGQDGTADVQAGEGAAKAALRPEHTVITQSAITIAGYTKMSRQALEFGRIKARC